jgi:hypothetical protein
MYTLMRFVFFLSLAIYQLEIKFSIHFVWSDISLRETIPQHFEPGPLSRPAPGPPTNLTGRAWAEILKPAKKFLARARPEILFLVVLHYKMRRRPAQARARPEPDPKIKAQRVQWMVMGSIFSARVTKKFRPGPNPARPEKCSPLRKTP